MKAVDVSDLRDCTKCNRLLCSGSWEECPGDLRDLVAKVACSEMERAERHRDELDRVTRLRDRVGTPDEPHTHETRRVA